MLIRFRTGNYGSFDDTQELSMTPGRTDGHREHINVDGATPLLRAAAIYGANASGKTNLIRALRSMRDMVVNDRKIPSDRWFRPNPARSDEPSYFEVEISVGDAVYSYGFDCLISGQKVVDEWLYRLHPDGDSDIVFQRAEGRITHTFEGPDKQRLDVYAEDMEGHDGRLFLNVMGRRTRSGGLGEFNDVYDWFARSLRFIDTEYPFSPEVPVSDEDFNRLNGIISTFGTGINDIGYVRKEGMEDALPQDHVDDLRKVLSSKMPRKLRIGSGRYTSVNNYRVSLDGDHVVFDEIVYRHNGDRVVYRPDEESDGTRRLFGLLASTFVGEDNVTYVIDELDTSLHPMLTFRFVDMFLKGRPGSQLVFTTHESSLMDFKLLRRDEIWFIEKDPEGRSRVYSLEDFNERNDRKIDKAYREGRYGGVPVFSTVYPPGSSG